MKQPIYIDPTGAVRWDRRNPDRPAPGSELARVHQASRILRATARTTEPGSDAEAVCVKAAAGVLLGKVIL